MAKINVITAETKTEGTRYSNVISVPVNAEYIIVSMPRKDMVDSKIAFAAQLFLSLDNGVSWRPWGGVGTIGGSVVDPGTGQPSVETSMKMKLLEPGNVNRKVKTTISITNEAKVGLDVEFI